MNPLRQNETDDLRRGGLRLDARIAALALLFLACAAPAFGQCDKYEIVAIIEGPQSCAFDDFVRIYPEAINDNMHVVGSWDCPAGQRKPFLWTPEGGLEFLDLPAGYSAGEAFGISNTGLICGWIGGPEEPHTGFIYENGQYTTLGIPPGGTYSEAYAVNDSAQVTGRWGNVIIGPGRVGFIWQDGVMTSLADDLGFSDSEGEDISQAGQITGWAGTNISEDARAFIWDAGNVTFLPPVPGGFTSEGVAINDFGEVAGAGLVMDDDRIPFRQGFGWFDNEMVVLGLLPSFERSFPTDISPDGTIVGYCSGPGGKNPNTAFRWRNGEIIAMNDLVVDLGLMHLISAEDINSFGEIVLWGLEIRQGLGVAVIARPAEPPLTDLDGDCLTNVSDLVILLDDWGQSDSAADFDHNGVVDFDDFTFLLSNWTANP